MINEIVAGDLESVDFSSSSFAVAVSRYNDSITEKLLQGALETLQQYGVSSAQIDVVRVPGAWELALVARQLALRKRHAGMICLGAVIRGETTHDQHINRFVSQAVGEISLEFSLPIAFGLLTCNSFEQAHARAGGAVGNKGVEAALTTLEMVGLQMRIDSL